MAFVPEIPFVAVLVAAVVYFALGWLWYSPFVLGKPWSKGMGMDMAGAKPGMKSMVAPMANHAVGALLLAFVFFHVMAAFGAGELADMAAGGDSPTADEVSHSIDQITTGLALQGAGWTWLGFMLPLQAGKAAWGGRPWSVVFIDAGYNLVGLAVMAVVIASMA